MFSSLLALLGHDLAQEHNVSLIHLLHARSRLLDAQIVLRTLIRAATQHTLPPLVDSRLF